ncbi:MAG: DUF4185 domain-containing protein [Limisphaerales bacterium]
MRLFLMFKSLVVFGGAFVLAAVTAAAGDISFRVSPQPEWNRMFQKTNGWLGADGDYSVPLGPDKTLWLFGDTFIGQVRGNQRTRAVMIHSSIAIQPFGKPPEFYYRMDKNHRPRSFIKSPGQRTYFWLSDGVRAKPGLYFFMQQIKWLNDSTWGFQCIGTWLAFVRNPDAAPGLWKITTRKLPFTRLPGGQDVVLGCETLVTPHYLYIYGYSNRTNSTAEKNLILARAPKNDPDDLNSWRFYSNGSWTPNFDKATAIFSGAGAEGSVSWQPFLKKFVFVYSDGIWGTIVMRTAGAPEGPWSAPIKLYQCPDMKISTHVFCYAAKGHPELSADDELLISYAANSDDLSEVMNDARLYWPRFIRVTFQKP